MCSVVKPLQTSRKSGLRSPTRRIQLLTAKAAKLKTPCGMAKSRSTVLEPRWGVAIVVTLAILSPKPRDEASIRASRPPLEWATRFSLSAPVSRRISSARSFSAAALTAVLAQQSCCP